MEKIPRIYIEGSVYYVTSRGDNEEVIFKDSRDFRTYIELFKKYKEQFGCRVFSFILLPNHVHLLIEPREGCTVSRIMHALNSNYTKYFNSRYGRKGHLLQERAKITILEKSGYLPGVSAYIHKNPCKLGFADDPGAYEFSSYRAFARQGQGSLFDMQAERREMEALLSQAANAPLTYPEYMGSLTAPEMEALGKELARKNILGSDDFVAKVRAEVEREKTSAAAGAQGGNEISLRRAKMLIPVFCVIAVSLLIVQANLKNKLKNISRQKDMEYSERLMKDREFIKKDLRELYRADLVSYQAMQKRLDIEKKKVKELTEEREKAKGGKK